MFKINKFSDISPLINFGKNYEEYAIDNLIFRYNLSNYKGTNLILGQCNKNLKINNKVDIIKKLMNQKSYWNKEELVKINKHFKNYQYKRLFEWILSKILIKIGCRFIINNRKEILYKKIHFEISKNLSPKLKFEGKNIHHQIKNEFSESFISISHSSSKIHVAICSQPIGIDCEDARSFSKELRKKFVKNDEFDQLESLLKIQIPCVQNKLDTIIWCIKESTLKIIGGIKIGNISQVNIEIRNHKIISSYPSINYEFVNFINIKNDSILILTFKENKVII